MEHAKHVLQRSIGLSPEEFRAAWSAITNDEKAVLLDEITRRYGIAWR